MDFNSTIDLIKREIDEAYEIIDDLKKSAGIQMIQIELAKSKCRNAAMAMELLKSSKPEPEKEKPAGEDATSGTFKEHRKEKDPEVIPSEKVVPRKKEVEPEVIPATEPVKKTKEKKETGKPEIAPVIETAREEQKDIEETDPDLMLSVEDDNPHTNKPYVAPIIADSFSHLANRFNEQMSQKTNDSTLFKNKPVTSLSTAIAINEKFYFIREIFNGDKDAYTRAIHELENVKNIEEAKIVIKNYSRQNPENEASIQLLDLVKRKLSPDE